MRAKPEKKFRRRKKFEWQSVERKSWDYDPARIIFEEANIRIEDNFGIHIADLGRPTHKKKRQFKIQICEFGWGYRKWSIVTTYKTENVLCWTIGEAKARSAELAHQVATDRLQELRTTKSAIRSCMTPWEEAQQHSQSYVRVWRQIFPDNQVMELGQLSDIPCLGELQFYLNYYKNPTAKNEEKRTILFQDTFRAASADNVKARAKNLLIRRIEKHETELEKIYDYAFMLKEDYDKATYCKTILHHISDTLSTKPTSASTPN